MKKLIIILFALLPLLSIAGNLKGGKKNHKADVKITTKDGKVSHLEIKIDGKDLKDLEDDLNKTLKNVSIKIDGNSKHEIQFKAEIKTE